MKNLPDFFRRGALNGSPYRDLLNFQRQMDRMFDEMWRGSPTDLAAPVGTAPAFTPSCDVEESGDHYLMSFDLPGVKKEDIKIDVRDGLLTVSGERKDECEQKDKNHYHMERFYGSFNRTFQLPAGVKSEQVEAHYSDGVLRLAVPKAEAAKTQQIKIGEGKSGLWEKLLGHKKQETKSAPQPQEKRPSEKVA